jgi:hypothetical protein
VIDRRKVTISLEHKRALFRDYTVEAQRQRDLAATQLDAFLRLDCQTILDRVSQAGVTWPGALPSAELDNAHNLCLPFGRAWANHQEARAWAKDVLQDQPVVAVDGSQIIPTKDHSIPVGAIQVGWYINYHTPGGAYRKDVEFEVLAPQELIDETSDGLYDSGPEVEGGGFPSWRISQTRFVRECQKLCELMAEWEQPASLANATTFAAPTIAPGAEHVAPPAKALAAAPLCFFDGSFIVSFAGQMRPARARPYVQAVAQMLDCADRYQTPLVAFIDRSYSRDFASLLGLLTATPDTVNLSDSALFARFLPQWGDRTPFFYCAREDALSREGLVDFYKDVVFTYIRLTADRPPARLEMPAWLLESGQAEAIVDRVRAECVVGSGYPYAIETADAVAVIGHQDRQRFYALFQQFLASEGIQLTYARKAASKESRR